ncbi:MAG: hypothetical protein JXB15_17395 [Anaerolineales bacterium]|nr:hypothetical protein [Anaerolineales bacterium]
MTSMHIFPAEISEAGHRVHGVLQMGTRQHDIYYQSDDCELSGNLETFLAIALLPCMKQRAACVVEGNVSPRFLSGIQEIQSVFHSWKPGMKPIEIQGATPQATPRTEADRVGVFFSGGVDSFYSFLKNRDEITDLIFIQGFDIPHERQSIRSQASEMVRKVGQHFGKGVIEVDTNIRSFLDQYLFWGYSHGAAMASVGHLLAQQFKRIYIAASYTEPTLVPFGSHPHLDPFWSSETLEFIHDGLEISRVGKIALLAEHDIALQSLRVCLSNPGGAYNCGRCEKCLRTMIYLRVHGVLDRCTTFSHPLDLRRVARLKATSTFFPFEESLKILEEKQTDPELAGALRKILYRPAWQKRVINWVRKERRRAQAALHSKRKLPDS